MRILLRWLREICPVDLPERELADALTMLGANVEAVLHPWEWLEGVVVAHVLEVHDHPDSQKLCVARITERHDLVAAIGVIAPDDVWALIVVALLALIAVVPLHRSTRDALATGAARGVNSFYMRIVLSSRFSVLSKLAVNWELGTEN